MRSIRTTGSSGRQSSLPSDFVDRAYRRPTDFAGLLAIESAAGAAAWSRHELRDFLGRRDTTIRVIARRASPGEPIAFYALQELAPGAYLGNLAVAPAWRRRGVASFALGRAEAWARRRGLARIFLHVQEDNLAAQLLYRKRGYVADQILHRYYRGKQDGYRMAKPL